MFRGSEMDGTVWVSLAGVLGAVLTYLGIRYSGKSSVKVAETSASKDAYSEALEIWKTTVADLREQVGEIPALREQVERLNKTVSRMQAENATTRTRLQSASRREVKLEHRVRQLETFIQTNGWSAPPWDFSEERTADEEKEDEVPSD